MISDLAFAISVRFLKFLICAYDILVIIPKSGLTIFVNSSISLALSIPTSRTANLSFFFTLNKLNGTPNLLLKD